MDPNNMKLPKPLDSRSGPQAKPNQPIRNSVVGCVIKSPQNTSTPKKIQGECTHQVYYYNKAQNTQPLPQPPNNEETYPTSD